MSWRCQINPFWSTVNMEFSDFKIGEDFTTALGEKRWRCTDIGTRVIVAVDVKQVLELQPKGLGRPPYIVQEIVFDEYDFEGCEPVTELDDEDRQLLDESMADLAQERPMTK